MDRETTTDVMYGWGQQHEKQLDREGVGGYLWTLDEVRHKVDAAIVRSSEKPRGWRLEEYVYRIYERELPDVAYNQVEIEDSGDELVAVEQIEQHEQATVIPPAVVAGGDEWPEPQELRPDFLDVPPFPMDALRSVCPTVADVCDTLAYHFQVPVDLPATMALAMMSISLAGKVMVEISPNQFYHVMIWTFLRHAIR